MAAVAASSVTRHAVDATPARRRGGGVSHRSIRSAWSRLCREKLRAPDSLVDLRTGRGPPRGTGASRTAVGWGRSLRGRWLRRARAAVRLNIRRRRGRGARAARPARRGVADRSRSAVAEPRRLRAADGGARERAGFACRRRDGGPGRLGQPRGPRVVSASWRCAALGRRRGAVNVHLYAINTTRAA